MLVVYFDQQLGAAHPKRWSKYTTHTVENTFLLARRKRERERREDLRNKPNGENPRE